MLYRVSFLFLAFIIQTSCIHDTQQWFDNGALRCNTSKSLHVCSQWGYLSEEKFSNIIYHGVDKLNPALEDGDSIFDLGMGVGAVFQSLNKRYKDLKIGGSDLSEAAINVAKGFFKNDAKNFFAQDMTLKHEEVPDNSYDHVASFGALGMYLTKEQMLISIKEAVRMTKPGGSLIFTHFLAPKGRNVGSILHKVERDFWLEELKKEEYHLEDIRVEEMIHQGDRYQLLCRKKS